MDLKKIRYLYFTVFFVSFSVLCYEIFLTQIFSILQWHNLAALIISLALLGFGVSGSIIFIFKKKIKGNIKNYIFGSLLLYPLFISVNFIILCKLPFNPFEIGIDNIHILYFLLYCILLGIPFFFAASIICLCFMQESIGKVYFFNLTGSGLGALSVIIISCWAHPFDNIIFITISVYFILLIFSFNYKKIVQAVTFFIIIVLVSLFYSSFNFFKLKEFSEYKPISAALNLPESNVAHERYSPQGVVHVVEAEGLRVTTGLSIISPFQIPIQKVIFFNGGGGSAITPYTGENSDVQYLHYVSSVLPYYILHANLRNKVLIVGSGGGEGILKALLYGFKKIYALELNSNVLKLMKNEYADFSGNIYNNKNVVVINKEARSFLRRTDQKYDLIDISMLDSYTSAASGTASLNENYLYTIEAIKNYFNHLSEKGILALTRWIVIPPRDNLKLFNICIAALQNMNIENIEQHIICIRTVQAVTLLISKQPFSSQRISLTNKFCETRLFDLVYFPGIKISEINKYIILEKPVFYQAISAFLKGEGDVFIKNYDYNIEAATDDSPYFYNFFKGKLLDYILKYGTAKVPFTEWGYFTLIIVLLIVIIISFISILVPLIFIRGSKRKFKFEIVLYFGLIAMGYFFIEMFFMQKMILFLEHPVYSISAVISSLLIFSGVGSFFSEKIIKRRKDIILFILLIIFTVMIYLFCLDSFLMHFIKYSVQIKYFFVVLLLFPLGFCMGFPFPAGLNVIKKLDSGYIAWAWGINSFFSVISILLASIFAIFYGFRFVLIIAAFLYLISAIIVFKLD